MGMILFLTVVIVEVLFAVFCLISKSDHRKERSVIRIAFFSCFVTLVILAVIDWNFRYYALGLLLLMLAVIGLITLMKKTENNLEFKAGRVILKTIGMIALFFVAALPAILFPQNSKVIETTGEYLVVTNTFTYEDTSRIESYSDTGENRSLNVEFWYPDDVGGTYPLIVFSHGGLGVKASNESLYNELASHGYVVVSIDHTYQCFFTSDDNGDTTLINMDYMQELSNEDPLSDIKQSYALYQKWMKIRMDDINFVMDHIISEAGKDNSELLYSLVDTTKIGVMGHSLGGSAALGIGRVRDDVDAVIALESPYMWDIEGVEDGDFVFTDKIYPVPVLNVYSDSAWSILGDRPQYAENFKMLSDNDDTTFNVYISGVGHLALTDFALTSPFLTGFLDGKKQTTEAVHCLKIINKISLEFFNSYLKGEGEFTSEGTY